MTAPVKGRSSRSTTAKSRLLGSSFSISSSSPTWPLSPKATRSTTRAVHHYPLRPFPLGRCLTARPPTALGDYVGFFRVLWLTWLQVSMHDVRFPRQSVLERVFKACHLGVMLGFAVVGVYFEPTEDVVLGVQTVNGHAFSRALLASRLTLFAECLLALWLVRRFQRMYVPLLLTGATYLISALAYLGISYAFEPQYQSRGAFAGWYVVAVVETGVVLVISVCFRGMGFRGTHISERMTLLTLIILGEGTLGLATSIGTAWKVIADSRFALEAFIGGIIAAVLIIYFAYMLYFDMIPAKGFSDIKHTIWTALHLPLHVFTVIFVEGNAKAITWLCAVTTANRWIKAFSANALWIMSAASVKAEPAVFPAAMNYTAYFADQAAQYNKSAEVYLKVLKDEPARAVTSSAIAVVGNGTQASLAQLFTAQANLGSVVSTAIVDKFGIETRNYDDYSSEAVDSDDGASPDIFRGQQQKFAAYFDYWELVFVYLFVTAGFLLLLVGCTYFISRKIYNRHDYARFAACLAGGVTVGLLSLMSITAHTEQSPGYDFIQSWWMLPTITLVFFSVVVVRHAPLYRLIGDPHPYAKV